MPLNRLIKVLSANITVAYLEINPWSSCCSSCLASTLIEWSSSSRTEISSGLNCCTSMFAWKWSLSRVTVAPWSKWASWFRRSRKWSTVLHFNHLYCLEEFYIVSHLVGSIIGHSWKVSGSRIWDKLRCLKGTGSESNDKNGKRAMFLLLKEWNTVRK